MRAETPIFLMQEAMTIKQEPESVLELNDKFFKCLYKLEKGGDMPEPPLFSETVPSNKFKVIIYFDTNADLATHLREDKPQLNGPIIGVLEGFLPVTFAKYFATEVENFDGVVLKIPPKSAMPDLALLAKKLLSLPGVKRVEVKQSLS